jgi:hypothetical protein
MKKLITLSFIAAVIVLSITSCKSHERCPAYSKVEQGQKQSI